MIYLPGDELPQSIVAPRGSYYAVGRKKFAAVIGIVEDNLFTPYELAYKAKVGDSVVGIVIGEKGRAAYIIDTLSGYTMLILTREVQIKLKKGDVVFGKIVRIEDNTPILGNVRKLECGRIIKVPPSKIPRVIGANASMIKLLREKTKSEIFVGANGLIFVRGGKIDKVTDAIKKIAARAHLRGLTDYISQLLG